MRRISPRVAHMLDRLQESREEAKKRAFEERQRQAAGLSALRAMILLFTYRAPCKPVALFISHRGKGMDAELLSKLNPQVHGREFATCTLFKNEKGYGFIVSDSGGRDIFVHVRCLPGQIPLTVGERVSFIRLYAGDGRCEAGDVRVEK